MSAPIVTIETTADFLHAVFGHIDTGVIEITCIAPQNAPLKPHIKTMWADLPLTIQDAGFGLLNRLNGQGYGIYFGCAVRKYSKEQGRGKQEDAQCITCLWCDVDDVTPEEGRAKLLALHPWPSIMVNSGGGVHGYWLLHEPVTVTEASLPYIRRVLHGIALALGSSGDQKVRDLARVMRLPGFINTKHGIPCTIADALPCYYTFEEIAPLFARHAPSEMPPVRRAIPVQAGEGLPQWVETYLAQGAPVGERNNMAYAAARELFDNGYDYSRVQNIIWQRASADGLDEREVTALVGSAHRAPRQTPNIPSYMSARMAAADQMLGGAK